MQTISAISNPQRSVSAGNTMSLVGLDSGVVVSLPNQLELSSALRACRI